MNKNQLSSNTNTMSWQPRLDKNGPLIWNNVTFQCVLQIPKIYGVPYDWVCFRESNHYRYYINSETLNYSGEAFYNRLQQNRSEALTVIRQHRLLLRKLHVVHQKLLNFEIDKLNRRALNALFKQVLAAHIPANGFIFFGSIIDTWANQLESMLRERLSADQAKRTLILLLTQSNKKVHSLKLGKQIGEIASIIRDVGQAMFELREQIEKNRALFSPVLNDIRRRMNINLFDWEHISWKQVADFLISGALPVKADIRANVGINVLAVVNSRKIELHGNKAKRWFSDLIDKGNVTQEKVLRGTSASSGKTSGQVRVIRNSNDFSRFRMKEVLVAFMTTPPYVPIISKAAAIITEVGGVTSHAAVVSRELGKPCIVGVRDATRLLKTGDFVEVDANKGVIKKL